MSNPTATFAEDAAIVAAGLALDLPRPTDPQPAIADASKVSRHVLIVEPDGWAYVAPHTPRGERLALCEDVARAGRVFCQIGTPPAPGRYWCDVSPDGNFEIGSRVAA